MNILFLLTSILTVESFSDMSILFGNFDDGLYNSRSNNYFQKNNIIPINKDNAITICNGWRITNLIDKDIQKSYYINFVKNLKHKSVLSYKWVPLNDKSYIKGIICLSINKDKKELLIRGILPNPYVNNFDIASVKKDIEKIKLEKHFSQFTINYDLFKYYDSI